MDMVTTKISPKMTVELQMNRLHALSDNEIVYREILPGWEVRDKTTNISRMLRQASMTSEFGTIQLMAYPSDC